MHDAEVLELAQIARFQRDGYLLVRGMYSTAEACEISCWTDQVAALPESPGRQMMYYEDSLVEAGKRILSRVENFVPYHPGFRVLITAARMYQAVSQLFGEAAVLFKDKINFKLPGADGFKAHQDAQAGWEDYAELHITAMIAIDQTTAANGSLEMIPGLHQQGILGEKWRPLSDADTGHQAYRPLHCQPGDAVFFDSYVPHRSGPNTTAKQRRVLYITYNKLGAGDHRNQYYLDKRASYPPDIERDPGRNYQYKV